MTFLLYLLCLSNIMGVAILALAVYVAPDGFEDSEGFHRGSQPFDGTAQQKLALALGGV